MLRPIGSQPSSVYWRRRLVLIGSVVLLVVLAVLTVKAVKSGGGGVGAAGSSSITPLNKPTSVTSSNSAPSATTPKKSSASSTSTGPGSSSVNPLANCVTKSLELRAVASKAAYRVGDTPTLQLQVTNTGGRPCAQDLSDKGVELRVYNGESRVWGSHDCKVEPGATVRTLAPNVSVLVSVRWSGLTSHKSCTGTRQRVGAGTYTLYALLSGRTGKATQFTIS